jgi:Mg2+/Co2+ transporter CorB
LDSSLLFFLLGLVVVLIALSGFFAGTETALMAINRYRLRSLAKSGNRAARYVEILLARPDRLIGMILLGNIAVHNASVAIVTYITLRLFGEAWIAVATGLLTVLILIFGEIAPKTWGAVRPERLALPSAFIYMPLQWAVLPIVYVANLFSNGFLRLLGISPEEAEQHSLSTEELRTVVAETGALLPRRHKRMLLSILDLEKITVEDIMVPRTEIVGIDVSEDWDKVLKSLVTNQHTRLPIFDGGIDELRGLVHLRRVLGLYADGRLTRETMLGLAREPYYVPAGTPLNQQLVNFQHQKRRIGFVVDEYGDLLGLVTLEDILEEIVGDFTSDPLMRLRNVTRNADGSFTAAGTVTVRMLNRATGWKLPTSGPRTLNGLIVEYLEDIPQPGTALRLGAYTLEIAEMEDNVVRSVRIRLTETEQKTA